MNSTFRALRVSQSGTVSTAELTDLTLRDLSSGDVVVRVEHSGLNYKDALAITGRAPIIRRFPLVPGIDLAGVVVDSESPLFAAGNKVMLNGCGVGEEHDGGLAQFARVKSEWLLNRPETVSSAAAMSLGTAGCTAMMCLMALQENGVRPDSGPLLITGASGGVGSISVQLAARAGFHVVACTGRLSEGSVLRALGAADVVSRADFANPSRPLQKMQWAGAIDVAGSHTLANVLAQMKYGGVVAACGLAHGMDLPTTVAPFILRSVRLIGVETVQCPAEQRRRVWARLLSEVDFQLLQPFVRHIPLNGTIDGAGALLNGEIRGRLVVDLW